MSLIHKGVELTQQQIDAINHVLIEHMNGGLRGKKKFHAAIDKALEEAGCPIKEPLDSPAPTGASGQP